MGGVLTLFPFPQSVVAPKSTAVQIGGILQYKWEVYCDTFLRSSGGWGFWHSSDERASWRSSQSCVTRGSAACWKIPTDSCHFFCTPGNPCATPIVTRGQGSFSYQGVSTRGLGTRQSLSQTSATNRFFQASYFQLETNLASRWEGVRLPWASGKSPDFPGSFSATVELNSNPGLPWKFPRLPWSSPDFPGSSPDFPRTSKFPIRLFFCLSPFSLMKLAWWSWASGHQTNFSLCFVGKLLPD